MSDSSTHTIQVWLRFYGELNDLLSARRRQITFSRILPEPTSVKGLIEGCGVPHTEVDLILVNGRPVDFFPARLKAGSVLVSIHSSDPSGYPGLMRNVKQYCDLHLVD